MKVMVKLIVHDHIFDESDHRNLTAGKIYDVIEIDHESFRVVDDDGEPFLFKKELFSVVDGHVPNDWVTSRYEDGQYFICPPELSHIPFFYEDYFNRIVAAVDMFDVIRQKYGLPPRQDMVRGKPRKPLKP